MEEQHVYTGMGGISGVSIFGNDFLYILKEYSFMSQILYSINIVSIFHQYRCTPPPTHRHILISLKSGCVYCDGILWPVAGQPWHTVAITCDCADLDSAIVFMYIVGDTNDEVNGIWKLFKNIKSWFNTDKKFLCALKKAQKQSNRMSVWYQRSKFLLEEWPQIVPFCKEITKRFAGLEGEDK